MLIKTVCVRQKLVLNQHDVHHQVTTKYVQVENKVRVVNISYDKIKVVSSLYDTSQSKDLYNAL